MTALSEMRLHDQNPSFARGPLPVAAYLSQQQFESEIREIFMQDWLWVGREEDIPDPGDYKIRRLQFANTSILTARGKDGVIRSFHNVCRHRGNKVVPETGDETYGSKKGAVFTCRFHGWVYGADGQLRDVPGQKKFPACFEKSENNLVPVATDVWEGFVFINLAKRPKRTLLEFIGGVNSHLAGFPFGTMTHVHTYSAQLKASWKVGMDAFMEAYHVPTIHSGSFPGLTEYWQDDFVTYGDHRSIALYTKGMNPGTPVGNAANSIFAGSIALAKNAPFPLPKTVNPNRSKNWGFEQTVVFPNTLIHVAEGLWFTHMFWPVTQDTCLWEGRYYLPAPKTNSQHWAQRYAVLLQRNAWLEDTATMEDTQAALKSGVIGQINIQDDEIMLRHAFDVIARRIDASRAPEAAR